MRPSFSKEIQHSLWLPYLSTDRGKPSKNAVILLSTSWYGSSESVSSVGMSHPLDPHPSHSTWSGCLHHSVPILKQFYFKSFKIFHLTKKKELDTIIQKSLIIDNSMNWFQKTETVTATLSFSTWHKLETPSESVSVKNLPNLAWLLGSSVGDCLI